MINRTSFCSSHLHQTLQHYYPRFVLRSELHLVGAQAPFTIISWTLHHPSTKQHPGISNPRVTACPSRIERKKTLGWRHKRATPDDIGTITSESESCRRPFQGSDSGFLRRNAPNRCHGGPSFLSINRWTKMVVFKTSKKLVMP